MPRSWDIFCRVVDNFGDIAVCWRLARQLAGEHGGMVRLWVDDLAPLHALCREVAPNRARQWAAGIEVHRWAGPLSGLRPAEAVVEGFGCGLPDEYVQAMVACEPSPLWIVLEYLSAERWVPGHHGLPSPHPRWAIPRYFFFPGFVTGTGGLLREGDLAARRANFDAEARRRAWATMGFDVPSPESTVVSMFAYGRAPLPPLLDAWERSDSPMVVAVPEGKIVRSVLGYLGIGRAEPGQRFRRGGLEVRILPFLEQTQYDELLWSCNFNFVRGEDSFVRAQWAELPLVWHIYPQAERAHWHKLEAFLELYCAGLPQPAAVAVRRMWKAWNADEDAPASVATAWREFQAHRATLVAHARTWALQMVAFGDMAMTLVRFSAERLKY